MPAIDLTTETISKVESVPIPTIPNNPVVLILRNSQSNRLHPIVFWQSTDTLKGAPEHPKWKSVDQYQGFEELHEAIHDPGGVMEICHELASNKFANDVYYDIHNLLDWDGMEIPEMSLSFNLDELTKY